jgi:O-antigen/teichoic acid export membrane protein
MPKQSLARVGGPVVRFLLVSVPKVASGVGTVALNIFLLRRLPEEDLALISLCLAGVLLVDSIAGSALDLGTLKLASSVNDTDRLVSLEIQKHAIYFKLIALAFAAILVVLVGKPFWNGLTHQTSHHNLLFISLAAAGGLLLVRSAQVQMQVDRKFFIYGLLDTMHVSLRFGGIAVVSLIGLLSPSSILVCYVVAPACVILAWLLLWGRRMLSSLRVSIPRLREIFECTKWFLLTFSLSTLISRMDLLLVSRWSGLKEAGYYAAGQIFAMIPQLLGLYMSVVLGPSIMPRIRSGTFFAMFRSTQLMILSLSGAGYVLFLVLWPLVSPLILPERYLQAGAVIKALIPGAFAGMATFPLILSFVMFIRPRFLFSVDCVSLPFLLLLYWYAIRHFGAAGAAVVTSFAALSRAAIAQVMAWRWARETGIPGVGSTRFAVAEV